VFVSPVAPIHQSRSPALTQKTGGINHLPPQVTVIHVSNEQRLGRESVRLNIHIGPSNLVDKTTLSDVGVSTDDQRSRVRVDGGETRNVLSDLFEVGQRFFLTTHDRGHSDVKNVKFHAVSSRSTSRIYEKKTLRHPPSERGLLQLLASVQTISKLQQPHVILSDLIDQVPRRVQLTEGELVMVLVVQDVEEGGEERVEVLQMRARGLVLCA
jgi:hypothetical protein